MPVYEKQCCGSGMFIIFSIPDPNCLHPGSTCKNLSTFNPKETIGRIRPEPHLDQFSGSVNIFYPVLRNYEWILEANELFDFRHTIKLTADRKRGRPAEEVTWTTQEPPRSRRPPPEDTMTKEEKISDEAAAAETEGDFWSLFMLNDIIAEITLRTMEWKN